LQKWNVVSDTQAGRQSRYCASCRPTSLPSCARSGRSLLPGDAKHVARRDPDAIVSGIARERPRIAAQRRNRGLDALTESGHVSASALRACAARCRHARKHRPFARYSPIRATSGAVLDGPKALCHTRPSAPRCRFRGAACRMPRV
jgi:hypothetical protein